MTELMRWLGEHGKDTLESVSLICGLFFAAASFTANARERRVSNLMSLVKGHRDLWSQVLERPELARVLKADVDLLSAPVTVVEERFVHLIITHLAAAFIALQSKQLPAIQGLEEDVREFFALPIPAKVWQWSRRFQEKKFVAFVERLHVQATDQDHPVNSSRS